MRAYCLSLIFSCLLITAAHAWGQEGHSIVAEIAQRRLSPEAADAVGRILGRGHSLASVGSWADDVRDARPSTYNWHFVDIPIARSTYDAGADCKQDPEKGDCTIAELERLKTELRCGSTDKKIEALKFAVHFVGDAHQPLHTVLEERGGNGVQVDIFMQGKSCTGTCHPTHNHSNFHAAWDTGLIMKTVWDWGAYVDRLEDGWLQSEEAKALAIGTPTDWILETHVAAQSVWNAVPDNKVLDDNYYNEVLPVLDRQLGKAGIRLAAFLNNAYASNACPAQ
ncbi:S1/P1 nuclease [Bradyrhizobium sp. CIAT3101]|uniref:S1/P1 nuclease n=1 Tax=Bradyrhizobium sp. CIAT3101 TaxID=439387 RepID=UPI0024B1A8E1|nr:S1/P1 nuclease [Bradyrhizobium sp. CIAT3101]WFU80317.1 S1/P1 nuclease [Bradyrhizobium sp. CIAT3101]